MNRLLYIITERLAVIVFSLVLSPLAAMAQVECEDTCQHVHGIDISHYQRGIFWETLSENSNMAYVYIKATEGEGLKDDMYAENIQMAHRYGLKVGAYHFWRPRIDQQQQVDNFLASCRPQDQDLIPMMDIEVTAGLSREALRDSLQKFLFIIENSIRQKPLIYTGQSFYNEYLSGLLDDYKLMVARYNVIEPELADGKEVFAWQYTEKGRINGISGYVDKSRLCGNHVLRELRWRRGKR